MTANPRKSLEGQLGTKYWSTGLLQLPVFCSIWGEVLMMLMQTDRRNPNPLSYMIINNIE